jgi:hypothetical protein
MRETKKLRGRGNRGRGMRETKQGNERNREEKESGVWGNGNRGMREGNREEV